MKNLMNFSGSALTRSEMKNIKGGATHECQCNGVGTWTGTYNSDSQVQDALTMYCSGGGTCKTC